MKKASSKERMKAMKRHTDIKEKKCKLGEKLRKREKEDKVGK